MMINQELIPNSFLVDDETHNQSNDGNLTFSFLSKSDHAITKQHLSQSNTSNTLQSKYGE